jgi:hypothetical protein
MKILKNIWEFIKKWTPDGLPDEMEMRKHRAERDHYKQYDNNDKTLEALVRLQQKLLKEKISIMVKHYESGSFSFVAMKHNGDATGWTKISPFIAKGFYSYKDALEGGINWYNKYKKDEELSSAGLPIAPDDAE